MCKIVPTEKFSCKETVFVRKEFEHITGVSDLPPWMQFDRAKHKLQQLGLGSVCAVS